MNFRGKIREAEIEIRPLTTLVAQSCESALAMLADEIEPEQTEFYRVGIQSKLCIVSARNVPMADGVRTAEWDDASIFSVDADFIYDVLQVAVLLGMGYLPNNNLE